MRLGYSYGTLNCKIHESPQRNSVPSELNNSSRVKPFYAVIVVGLTTKELAQQSTLGFFDLNDFPDDLLKLVAHIFWRKGL